MQKPPGRLHDWFRGNPKPHPEWVEPPLRSELFSVEQLTRHARVLATEHRVEMRRGSNHLLVRLGQNEEVLRSFNRATLALDPNRRITPAAEWLLDNFYLIEEQVQMARRHLPKGYSRELPRLLAGPSAGLPRVYGIVIELISHVDAQIDGGPLAAFIASYQTVLPLKLGELWAIPIMLRLGLIENLQRVTTRLVLARGERDLAGLWVDRLQETAESDPSRLVLTVADLARSDPPVSSAFVTEFCQRLSRHGPVLHLARGWLEQHLLSHGLSVEQRLHEENRNLAADQVSVSHSITSLRQLSALDWKEFVEGLSQVEQTLRTDPSGVYGGMDFATRDRYRHAVEFLARHSRTPETEVAQKAIDLAARQALDVGPAHRTAHVGFHLVDQGQAHLGRLVRVHRPWRSAVERGIHRLPLTFYTGGIALLAGLSTAGFAWYAAGVGIPAWRGGPFAGVFLLCSSQMAVGLMNWLATLLVKPRLLPRMDFSGGIPTDCRTMVVIPTLLSSTSGVDHLLDSVEIHYLANRDRHLHFALLADFRDGADIHQPGDQELLLRARLGIESLNRKYPSGTETRFYLFLRPRRWNGSEGLWMGYERKRGKLSEFNALLRGGTESAFSEVVGDRSLLASIRYVITLDTDTVLPREAARKLVGTMAHPLNRPVFDEVHGVVSEGYSILQPRVGVSLPGARRSWFVRLFAGDAGIDPYTREVSDVYQDVFREGSFIGKGIYDVDAFERAMCGRFPDNTVLSHDLLEACHGRSGLVSDVEFYEEFPSRYNVDIERRHRWIRGDWQITQWLLPRVPGTDARRIANPLSGLSQWKIFDNLRRSLVPVGLMVLLPGSWILLPELAGRGTVLVLGLVALPGLVAALATLVAKPSESPLSLHLRISARAYGRQVGQLVVTLAFLPYDALISADAILRTLVRLVVTRRRLLEWRTSEDSEGMTRAGLGDFCRTMWVAPAMALTLGLLTAQLQPAALPAAASVLTLWLAAPWIAWWISRPIVSPGPGLSDSQRAFLHQTARRTWHYFDTFVTAGENWLPPDNFQEIPVPTIAPRTSPTNIGLSLLAVLAARDLGFLSTGRLIRRTADTLSTLQRLERHRGHFYNWYDTRTLAPMIPLYVSSVDSGNLAGHLLTLASGLREQADAPLLPPSLFQGVRDTLEVLGSEGGVPPGLLTPLAEKLSSVPDGLEATHAWLVRAVELASALNAGLVDCPELARRWGRALQSQCEDFRADLLHLVPWLDQPASKPALHPGEIPSLRFLARIDGPTPHLPGDALSGVDPWIREGAIRARQRLEDLEQLAIRCDAMTGMDFSFLYDSTRDLFYTGFNVAERRCDSSYYDLLASEARLCSYVAVALGQVPQEHWFTLGRLLVASSGEPLLVSWSGSMFEYLMPLLVMPNHGNTLLDHSCRAAVRHQIAYGELRGVPWGISESGYNRTDVHLNYQYRAFGVPGLGLKRGLGEDLVIAPYASAMALMVEPRAACENLQRLAAEGVSGEYGFLEAVDYTPARLPPDETRVAVRSFMAHHQGMSLLSLANLLGDFAMQRRFMACPVLKSADLLLQERMPRTGASVFPSDLVMEDVRPHAGSGEAVMRVFTHPFPPVPEVHLLSNGRYHVVVSSAGGGYSRWREFALGRWQEDATRDCWGTFVYLRDVGTGEVWSAAFQPARKTAEAYEAIFTQARAEFRQRHSSLEIHAEICVSPEDDVELRRIRITNLSNQPRELEVTTYLEVVLAPPASDLAHPAFSNLFVQTEFLPGSSALLCTRRARSPEEKPPWMMHLLTGESGTSGGISCETDRNRFIGRGRDLSLPSALEASARLSGTVGAVLDPILSLRRTVTLPAHGTAVVTGVFGVTESREATLALVERYQGSRMVERAFELAWTHCQVSLQQLGVTEQEAQLYGRLAGALIHVDPARRADPAVQLGNRRGPPGLWSHGISGDVPILLVRISDRDRIELARQLIQAHAYWRTKGLVVDLVILIEDASTYLQTLHERITGLIASGIEAQVVDRPGGVFVRRLDQFPKEDLVLLQAAARVVLDDEKGTLAEQWEHRSVLDPPIPVLRPTRFRFADRPGVPVGRKLQFDNGLGGFSEDGREYVITLGPGQTTPAPWINVLANPHFGTVVSESGSGYSWGENAHEFRLTPWSNDPVRDTPGEAFYLRDEQTGQFWSPTPLPAPSGSLHVVRHGFGYSVFEHTAHGIASELRVFVAIDASVKFMVLHLRNLTDRPRRLTVTGYFEWALGELRQKGLLHIQTEVDLRTGALLARNRYNTEFPDRTVFLDVHDPLRTLTGDRREFIGRNGDLSRPAALLNARLSGKVGAGLDPCGAIMVPVVLAPGAAQEVTFRLGLGRDAEDVQTLIRRFRPADAVRSALDSVRHHWERTLGAVAVETPDPATNLLANGWLLYQTLSCRVWGRSGFYQSGGAFGFRDQLQDVLALVHAAPALTREHLLRAAAHQFCEGDVQHWWHPPAGRGVRTHFSDDLLWLPYVTCHYVECLGDTGVLDERVPLLVSRPLRPDEEANYDLPGRAEEPESLYRHCVLAIERGLRFGTHGLPLIGCGDWNDGMNRVGREGRGESVWLAFFLHDVLRRFAALALRKGDPGFAERCRTEAARLAENIEAHAWDGQWYRRAYFDDGQPLGSATNPECQIDSLPQSWSVISGVGDPRRQRQAMESVERRLVRREAGLIQLFDPPFDTSDMNPGYIRGYIPGVRENGGQYTHGALWTVLAFAEMGDTERAWDLLGLLNPVHHGSSPERIAVYRVEPYVVAADVYAVAPHVGRGGWTWYTGSAGWMYRLLVETLLGLHREGDRLRLDPRIPAAWPQMRITYRFRETSYHITVLRPAAGSSRVPGLRLDGQVVEGDSLPLVDDQRVHEAELILAP